VLLVTGRRPLVSTIRQIATGMAAEVTFAVGTAIGDRVVG
jgi:hypothetical protein